MEDRCVICGAIIPEGSHVCPVCRQSYSKQTQGSDYDAFVNILRKSSLSDATYVFRTEDGFRVGVVSEHGYISVKFDKEGNVI